MVTGAGGSIGSELCRQILRLKPSRLVLVEHSEFALYKIHEELIAMRERFELASINIHPFLSSVRNVKSIERAFSDYSPNTVYHAAAYKHVPLVEENAAEGILNNIFGTKVVAELASKHDVEHLSS